MLGHVRVPFRFLGSTFGLGHGEPFPVVEGIAAAPAGEIFAIEERDETLGRLGHLSLRQAASQKKQGDSLSDAAWRE